MQISNLTATPELRFAPSGIAVANMTVAATPRYYDKQAGQWADGDTLFLRVTAWRQLAENAAESLSRGDRVVVTGRLRQKSYQTAEGEKRTSLELRRRTGTLATLRHRQGQQGHPRQRPGR